MTCGVRQFDSDYADFQLQVDSLFQSLRSLLDSWFQRSLTVSLHSSAPWLTLQAAKRANAVNRRVCVCVCVRFSRSGCWSCWRPSSRVRRLVWT